MSVTFRIVGGGFGRERVVASGLDREQAEAKLQAMKRDPLLKGIAVWLENEQEAANARDDAGRPVFTESERAIHGGAR